MTTETKMICNVCNKALNLTTELTSISRHDVFYMELTSISRSIGILGLVHHRCIINGHIKMKALREEVTVTRIPWLITDSNDPYVNLQVWQTLREEVNL